MKLFKQTMLFLLAITLVLNVYAHGEGASHIPSATYLGNEGVLISTADGKVLFDPFFHNNYGSYQLVPEGIRKSIFAGEEPYDKIDVVVISHAHGDHFSAEDSLTYLQINKSTKLVAPKQAIDLLTALEGSDAVASQLVSLEMLVGDKPITQKIGAIEIESVRIPHAGWPARKNVSNLVHRVSFGGKTSVIHMGDADPNDVHFKPYKQHWQETKSGLAFPPYWFFTSEQGQMILSDRINAEKSIGVHVPSEVPSDLKATGEDFFSKPGEQRKIIQSQ